MLKHFVKESYLVVVFLSQNPFANVCIYICLLSCFVKYFENMGTNSCRK